MSGPEFFQTRMGQQFYDGTMKRLADAAGRIADALEVLAGEQTARTGAMDAEKARRAEAWHALVGEMVELLHDHDTAWDNEEDSVKAEHDALIVQTRDLLARISGRKPTPTPPLDFDKEQQ